MSQNKQSILIALGRLIKHKRKTQKLSQELDEKIEEKKRLRCKLQVIHQKQVSTMIDIVTRLDKTQIFWDLDDFYQDFEANYAKRLKLSTDDKRKPCQSRLCLSEVMTIVVLFHGSGYKTFKEFYLNEVLKHWQKDFPKLVSYNLFLELIPWSLML